MRVCTDICCQRFGPRHREPTVEEIDRVARRILRDVRRPKRARPRRRALVPDLMLRPNPFF